MVKPDFYPHPHEDWVTCPACEGDKGFDDYEGSFVRCTLCDGLGDVEPDKAREFIRSRMRE
jgi:hypothetical protein